MFVSILVTPVPHKEYSASFPTNCIVAVNMVKMFFFPFRLE